jgi:hypothetical protein
MSAPRGVTLSPSTTVTYSNYVNLSVPPAKEAGKLGSAGAQIARFSLHVTAGSAPSATGASIRLVCADGDRVYWTKDGAISFATTIPRAGLDGASGAYIATLTFAETGSDKLDLLGSAPGSIPGSNDATWRVGLVGSTITNATGLTLYTSWSDQT